MPYTIYDAIRDEIEFLETLEKVEEREKHTFAAAIAASNRASLRRILRRVEEGHEFSIQIGKTDGKPFVQYAKTDRKTLEQEYPALKKAAEQYNLIQTLIDSEPEKGSE